MRCNTHDPPILACQWSLIECPIPIHLLFLFRALIRMDDSASGFGRATMQSAASELSRSYLSWEFFSFFFLSLLSTLFFLFQLYFLPPGGANKWIVYVFSSTHALELASLWIRTFSAMRLRRCSSTLTACDKTEDRIWSCSDSLYSPAFHDGWHTTRVFLLEVAPR